MTDWYHKFLLSANERYYKIRKLAKMSIFTPTRGNHDYKPKTPADDDSWDSWSNLRGIKLKLEQITDFNCHYVGSTNATICFTGIKSILISIAR